MLHGPSPEPAMIGPPPQSGDAGPLQAHVASDQRIARPVSSFAMPANMYAFPMPRARAESRMNV
jgi:hypothetical protein